MKTNTERIKSHEVYHIVKGDLPFENTRIRSDIDEY